MKTYRRLLESLPAKTVVFAFGRFNPPTTGHQLLVQFVKKLAQQSRADHIIYASRTQDAKKNPLTVERKIHYLNLMFPGTNFKGANNQERTFIEAAKELSKHYKNLIMVAGSDRVPEYQKLLTKYNGVEFNFDSVKVVSAGERDPDADDASGMSASKMRTLASKGEYDQFKKGLPSSMRDLDARRLMNDVRQGMGLEAIKEQIKLPYNALREKYFQGEIYQVGDIVESINGEQFKIIKRGTNHLLVSNREGKVTTKWLHEVVQRTRNSIDENKNILSQWKNEEPVKYVTQLIKFFGAPDELTPKRAVWYAKDGFKRVEVLDEYILHTSPVPHYDFVYSYVDLKVPHNLSDDLAASSESILLDHLKGEVGGRCASLSANAVTIQYVMDVVEGRVSPSKEEYEKRIKALKKAFKDGKRFELDWWPDVTGDTDPKNTYYESYDHIGHCRHNITE